MSLKQKFLKMLGDLTDDEKLMVREFLSETDSVTEPVPVSDNAPAADAADADGAPEIADAPGEQDETAEGQPDIDAVLEPESEPAQDDDAVIDDAAGIPAMSKTEPPPDESAAIPEPEPEPEPEPVIDTEGVPMPIDYQSIIDGLNAKYLALEAENKQLKAKTEGAFGYSSKPPGLARFNPLYDDDVSDIRFRK